jgi:hypothetical protein
MPRVKCPHCGAGNQDATEDDTCWQCGNVLGAPVARGSQARTTVFEPGAPTQQLDPSQMGLIPHARGLSQRAIAITALFGVCVLGGLIILLVWLLMSRPLV